MINTLRQEAATVIYIDDSDPKMLVIYRLHGRALKNLQAIIQA